MSGLSPYQRTHSNHTNSERQPPSAPKTLQRKSAKVQLLTRQRTPPEKLEAVVERAFQFLSIEVPQRELNPSAPPCLRNNTGKSFFDSDEENWNNDAEINEADEVDEDVESPVSMQLLPAAAFSRGGRAIPSPLGLQAFRENEPQTFDLTTDRTISPTDAKASFPPPHLQLLRAGATVNRPSTIRLPMCLTQTEKGFIFRPKTMRKGDIQLIKRHSQSPKRFHRLRVEGASPKDFKLICELFPHVRELELFQLQGEKVSWMEDKESCSLASLRLAQLRSLAIIDAKTTASVFNLPKKLDRLTFDRCAFENFPSILGEVDLLNISGCENLSFLEAPQHVKKIIIDRCHDLKTFKLLLLALGTLEHCHLQNCDFETFPTILGEIFRLDVQNCIGLHSVILPRSIKELNFIDCPDLTPNSVLFYAVHPREVL